MPALRTVCLDEELCRAAEDRFAGHFGGLEEMLNSLLQELLRDDAVKLDQREQHIIEERLRALGYV